MTTEMDAGRVTGREAAEVLALSTRQVRRLVAAYQKEGAAGLAHGTRGRVPHNKTPEDVRQQVLKLARATYHDCSDPSLTETLEEKHRINLSWSSVRRLRRAMERGSQRKRRSPRHRRQHERYPHPGMLLQLNGSPHEWLEIRGPRFTLLAAIDDATNKVPHTLFRGEKMPPATSNSC